jgi:glucosamine--fructose-6-phosphate aminotransferase (isomerizing)
MCGIIARVSNCKFDNEKTLKGLKELEYRGYDSYGILLSNIESNFDIIEKNKDTLDINILEKLKKFKSHIEIGHTRWATHGNISKTNAHPHFDSKKEVFVVMNGIIENYMELKNELENNTNIRFISETDTELIPQIFAFFFDKSNNDIKEEIIITIKKILLMLKGEFSFILKYKNFLIAYKNVNPIILGSGENEFFISSDSRIVQNNSDKFQILEDGDLCLIEVDFGSSLKYELYNKNFEKQQRAYIDSIKKLDSFEKNTKYYMEKEISDQINIRKILSNSNLENIKFLVESIKKSNKKIYISAAGTSYHASMYFHYELLKLNIDSKIIIASELKNYISIIKDSILIIFSQSGETADLIFPITKIKNNSNMIFTITNSENSSLDRIADISIYLNCGKEFAVASTKSFTFQLAFSLLFSQIYNGRRTEYFENFEIYFNSIIRENMKIIDNIANHFYKSNSFFYIGRDNNYPLALEGALKLKEISYIHAEGFAGGELKHGSLALIEKNFPVIVIGNGPEILSNSIEVKTRGGCVISISSKYNLTYDFHLEVPDNEYFPIMASIIMQIIALKITLIKGFNPDKPRNLAKSVTVK